MRITFEKDDSEYIASDDADGRFYLDKNGVVLYLGPDELEPWSVNTRIENFRHSVEAYNKYVIEIESKETEQEQLIIVTKFNEAILAIEDYRGHNKSYWSCIIQQAEAGQI
ncbi:hypothetical protein [Microbulbifer sp. PAAF003]|uniref:hypothetical protein n=1 Tax=Microbulbifer sp. PAAF003 TaxID=3243375 RepID=UPI00403942A2